MVSFLLWKIVYRPWIASPRPWNVAPLNHRTSNREYTYGPAVQSIHKVSISSISQSCTFECTQLNMGICARGSNVALNRPWMHPVSWIRNRCCNNDKYPTWYYGIPWKCWKSYQFYEIPTILPTNENMESWNGKKGEEVVDGTYKKLLNSNVGKDITIGAKWSIRTILVYLAWRSVRKYVLSILTGDVL